MATFAMNLGKSGRNRAIMATFIFCTNRTAYFGSDSRLSKVRRDFRKSRCTFENRTRFSKVLLSCRRQSRISHEFRMSGAIFDKGFGDCRHESWKMWQESRHYGDFYFLYKPNSIKDKIRPFSFPPTQVDSQNNFTTQTHVWSEETCTGSRVPIVLRRRRARDPSHWL